MRTLTTIVFAILIAFFSAQSVLAKEWRGIVPLRSVREDVERLLGPPSQSSPYGSYYILPDELAVINFQGISCEDGCGFGWNVPTGTVTSIGVIPRGNHRRKKFDLGGDFKVEDVGGGGFVYYTNERDGLSVEKYNETLTLVTYSAAQTEAALRCPPIKECIIDFRHKFDEYGQISFQDQKARLDNFAIQIKQMLGRGVIAVVGENRAVRNRLLKRAEHGKKHLVEKRGVEAERLLIVDGGYQSSSYTELHVYMIGGDVSRIYLYPEKDPNPVAPNKRGQPTPQ